MNSDTETLAPPAPPAQADDAGLFITYPHHSPSSISQFIEYRASWFLQKFKGQKFQSNQAINRGKAIEDGVNWFYANQGQPDCNVENAAAFASTRFNNYQMGLTTDDDIRRSIRPMTEMVIHSFMEKKNYGFEMPVTQNEFLIEFPGLKKPIKGFMDYRFDKIKRIVDLKCVGTTPSKLKFSYVIQGAVYKYVSGYDMEFHFAVGLKTPKTLVLKLSNAEYEHGLHLVKEYGKRIERIVESDASLAFLEDVFSPNPASYFNQQELAEAMQAFGM